MMELRTHRGFIVDRRSPTQGYIDFPLVEKLYQRMETTHDWQDDFGYLQQVVQVAKDVLFNARGEFVLKTQLEFPAPHWPQHFALSTLEYITGKSRTMFVENYRDLMAFHPKDRATVDFHKEVKDRGLNGILGAKPGDIISMWLQQDDGLTDLVQSLYLIASPLPENWHSNSQAK